MMAGYDEKKRAASMHRCMPWPPLTLLSVCLSHTFSLLDPPFAWCKSVLVIIISLVTKQSERRFNLLTTRWNLIQMTLSQKLFASVFFMALVCIQVGPESGRHFSPLPGGLFSPDQWMRRRRVSQALSSSLDLYEPSADNLRVIHILMAQLSGTVKAFSLSFFFPNSICDLCLQIKRGSKNKRKLAQPVSSQRESNTPFHVVTCCLFTRFWRISMDDLNIEHLFLHNHICLHVTSTMPHNMPPSLVTAVSQYSFTNEN